MLALHGVNGTGEVQLRQPKVALVKLHDVVATLPPCMIGIEACSGAYHWARLFATRGYGGEACRLADDLADATEHLAALHRLRRRFGCGKYAELKPAITAGESNHRPRRLRQRRGRAGAVDLRTRALAASRSRHAGLFGA